VQPSPQEHDRQQKLEMVMHMSDTNSSSSTSCAEYPALLPSAGVAASDFSPSSSPSVSRGASIDAMQRLVSPMAQGSMRGCILSLTFSAVGAGILGLPWAIAALGWGLGLAAILLCTSLSAISLCMLVDIRDAMGCASYASAVETSFGRMLANLLGFILVLGSFGSACVSIMFSTSFLVDLLETSLVNDLLCHFGLRDVSSSIRGSDAARPLCVAILVVLLALLSWSKDLTRYRYVTVACVVVMLYVSLALVLQAAGVGFDSSKVRCVGEPSDGFVFARWGGLTNAAQAVSVLLFSYCCHFNVFPVVGSLGNPTRIRAHKVCIVTTILQACLYLGVAYAGYAMWTQALLRSGNAQGNVLACWSVDNTMIAVGRVLMIGSLLISATLNVHPARENALRIVFSLCSHQTRARWLTQRGVEADLARHITNPEASPGSNIPRHAGQFAITTTAHWLYTLSTLLLLAALACVCIFVPSVLDALGFVGGLAGVALMFLFPAALYLKVCVGGGTSVRMGILVPMFGCFIVMSCLGFISAVTSVIHVLGPR